MRATLLKKLACGLRWVEATGLRVRDVSIQRRRLEINHTATEVDGNVVESETDRLCVGNCLDDIVFADRFGGFFRRPSASKN